LKKNDISPELHTRITTEGIELDGHKFKIEEAVGDELKLFWDKHGEHFKTCVSEGPKGAKERGKDKHSKGKAKPKSFEFAK